MTENAQKLITAKVFEALTGNEVYCSMWGAGEEFKIGHISCAEWADVVAVVPATANIIGKTANGICDDLLSTTLCACHEKKMIFAPAMNDKMWCNPAVKENVSKLEKRGAVMVGPAAGRLACGAEGVGRMTDVEQIISAICEMSGNVEK